MEEQINKRAQKSDEGKFCVSYMPRAVERNAPPDTLKSKYN